MCAGQHGTQPQLTHNLLQGGKHHTSHIHKQLGLHKQCSGTTTHNLYPGITSNQSYLPFKSDDLSCTPYPRYSDCHGGDRYFCSMWRSVGFLMSFAVVLEGMTIAAFVVLLVGGKQKREQGWGFMATMAALAALVQAVGGSIVVCQVYTSTDITGGARRRDN